VVPEPDSYEGPVVVFVRLHPGPLDTGSWLY